MTTEYNINAFPKLFGINTNSIEYLMFNDFIVFCIPYYYRMKLKYVSKYGYDTKSMIEYYNQILNIELPKFVTYNKIQLELIVYNNVIAYVDIYDVQKYEKFTEFIDSILKINYAALSLNLLIDKNTNLLVKRIIMENARPDGPSMTDHVRWYLHDMFYRSDIITSTEHISIGDLINMYNTDTKPARMIPLV